jgi:MSHA biogenesis protein MshJ
MKNTASSRIPPKLLQLLAQLQQRFESLAQREKVIVALVLLAGVVMLFQLVALDPLMKQREALQKQHEQLTQDINGQQVEREALAQAITAGPKLQKQQQLDALRQELTMLDEQIARTTATMIPPRKMTDVLREVMQLRANLKLVQLENLAPQPLLDDAKPAADINKAATNNTNDSSRSPTTAAATASAIASAAGVDDASNDVGLYRHGVKLVFEGDYMTTMAFLESLEQKSWRFFWQSLQYDVEKYPKARVTLTLYTLSPERAWLGV